MTVASERERAVYELRTLGCTVLDRRLPDDTLSRLRASFDAYLDAVLDDADPLVVHPAGPNRYNVWTSLEDPFLDADVVADPLVLAVLGDLLDGDVVCSYYASDTAFPGSEYQPIHLDVQPLFPGLGVGLPPFSYVLDIPLVEFTEENGPVELWPYGTHLVADSGALPKERAQAGPEARTTPGQRLAEAMGGRPLLVPAGALVLRDIRLWHRGTPNRSDRRRSMLALVYSRPWMVSHTLPMDDEVYQSLDSRVRSLFRNVARYRRRAAELAG
jgi:ectoine hydroxylase-related dioxygenase (phytanoyl-CoA dioxygenase family)